MKKIPLSIPNLTGNEKKYILDCIETNMVSSVGPYVNKFEEAFAKYHNVDSAVAVSNGTAALHLALLLSDVNQDDHVFVPNLTFIAPVNAVTYLKAKPVLIDSESESFGMCPETLEKYLIENYELVESQYRHKRSKEVARAVILMHAFGNIGKIEKIQLICKKFNLKLIEDACESLGAKYKGQSSGTFGDFGCFSFNGNKIVTSGGGGMLIAKEDKNAKKAKHLSTTAKIDGLNFIHDQVGFNYRMTNLIAALGLAQFEMLSHFLSVKRENFKLYSKELGSCENAALIPPPESSNFWFYCFKISNNFPLSKSELIDKLIALNIEVRPIWQLIEYQEPYLNCNKSEMTSSRIAFDSIINLPCSTQLTKEEIEYVSKCLLELGC